MRSALLILALTFWTALANPLPHNSTRSLMRRGDEPIRKYVCSNSTDKADRPRSCQGLVAKIKELRAKHTEKDKNQLFNAGLQDRKLCDGQCCISWSPNGDLLTFQNLFILYSLMRKESGCPTSKPVQWIDQTKGYALCLSGKGDECEYDDPLSHYVDEDDCPEGCYFDIVVDEEAVAVHAIGGSGRGGPNPIEKKATAWNAEQLAGGALDQCAKQGGCKSKTITDGVAYQYYCGKNIGAQCHVLSNWKDGLGPRTIRVSTYWEIEPEGMAAREKMVEVMKTVLRQTVQKVEKRKVRLNADDWAGVTYERVPKNFQVAIRGIPQKGKNSKGNIAKLVMGIASCNDSPSSWECGTGIGKIAVDAALSFMGPIGLIVGAANSPSHKRLANVLTSHQLLPLLSSLLIQARTTTTSSSTRKLLSNLGCRSLSYYPGTHTTRRSPLPATLLTDSPLASIPPPMPGRDTHHLPSPSLSPPGRVMSRQQSHPSCSDDDSDPAARSALEIRREKNRIKQRNLRQRRATQMADLERTVQSMRANTHDLEDRLAVIEQREASLAAWVRDLENALMANGHREHVESLRRVWGGSAAPESHSSQQSSTRDPLATLASAASSYRPSAHSQRWEEDESSSRKRRRQDDDCPSSSMHTSAVTRESHSPSRAMRIDQLCLPRTSTQSSSTPMSSESWGWNHVQSLDHQQPAYHQYETKPRVVPQGESSYDHKPRAASYTQNASHGTHSHPPPPSHDTHRSISPSDHRPMSASSSGGTSRSWHSPVQTFDVRL